MLGALLTTYRFIAVWLTTTSRLITFKDRDSWTCDSIYRLALRKLKSHLWGTSPDSLKIARVPYLRPPCAAMPSVPINEA